MTKKKQPIHCAEMVILNHHYPSGKLKRYISNALCNDKIKAGTGNLISDRESDATCKNCIKKMEKMKA